MRTLWQDLRYGARMLAKTPGLTAVAVLSLALGIGANTALFSVVDAVLLKKLPVREPGRLVLFKSLAPANFSPGGYNGTSNREESGETVRTSFPYQTYAMLRAQSDSPLSDVFAFGDVALNVQADGQAEVASGQAVSGNYFGALGVEALHGRVLRDDDDRAGQAPAAVISHRFWERRFGANPSVVGRQINLNNAAFTVVGVTPEGFDGTAQVGTSPDVSIPLALEPQVVGERSRMSGAGVWWLRLMGRLKEGATEEQARASLEGVFRQSVAAHREERRARAQAGQTVPPLAEADYPRLATEPGAQGEMNLRRSYKRPLYLLLGVVALVLLVACANVANLLLARAAARQREIAVRLALGASRRRLVRQLLTESVLLALVGGALGVLLAFWIKDGLLASGVWGGRGMSALDPQIDLRVLGFTFALASLTGILFGLAPAWRATRVDLTPALKASVGTSGAHARSLLSKSLVVAQVALTLLVLIGAGLFLRTLINLRRVETGFNARNLLIFRLDPGLIGYKDERLANLYEQMSERIEAVPGVRSVTFSRNALLSFASSSRPLYLPGAAPGSPPASEELYVHQVRENFLETMEIPLLAGRGLAPRDDARAPKVAVVNQTFARRFFGGENPVGSRLGYSADKAGEVEIVGVSGDAKYARQRDEVPPTIYVPWRQELRSVNSVTFEVRTSGDPEAFIEGVRAAAREVDANLPLAGIKTQVEQADETLAMERLFARLLGLFGLLAQQLAAIGLYGVLAWSVAQRTHEIGIRMALGASRRDVVAMILRQGMTLTLVGVALGLLGAYALAKYLESLTRMLYGVEPTDPLTFGAIALLLTTVALIACLVPARRATKVDPMEALRYE